MHADGQERGRRDPAGPEHHLDPGPTRLEGLVPEAPLSDVVRVDRDGERSRSADTTEESQRIVRLRDAQYGLRPRAQPEQRLVERLDELRPVAVLQHFDERPAHDVTRRTIEPGSERRVGGQKSLRSCVFSARRTAARMPAAHAPPSPPSRHVIASRT